MFSGCFFSTDELGLATWTRDLDSGVVRLFSDILDSRASGRVVLRPDELSGRGVFLADGVHVRAGDPLGFYFGTVRSWTPDDDYILALPPFRRGGQYLDLSLDAAALGRRANPDPLNVALYNHTCREASVRLRWLQTLSLPCMVAAAPPGLLAGAQLRWNYVGIPPSRRDCHALERAERDAWVEAGFRAVPCACTQPAGPCPRDRWFKIWPRTAAARSRPRLDE